MNVLIYAAPLNGYVFISVDVEAEILILPAEGVFASDLISQTPRLSLTSE